MARPVLKWEPARLSASFQVLIFPPDLCLTSHAHARGHDPASDFRNDLPPVLLGGLKNRDAGVEIAGEIRVEHRAGSSSSIISIARLFGAE
jgi:hypothetical protein